MIEIKKGTEPKELLEYRKQEFASYADMKGDVKEKVMKSLLSEQGHLCAYCMSRIDEGDGKHRATIEHCIQQAVTDEKERLNYKNMVAVCWGNRDAHSNEDKSCDAKRGSLKVDKQDDEKNQRIWKKRQNKAIEEKQNLLKDIETKEVYHCIHYIIIKNPLISVSNLSLCYGERQILSDVSFEIKQGDIAAIVWG